MHSHLWTGIPSSCQWEKEGGGAMAAQQSRPPWSLKRGGSKGGVLAAVASCHERGRGEQRAAIKPPSSSSMAWNPPWSRRDKAAVRS